MEMALSLSNAFPCRNGLDLVSELLRGAMQIEALLRIEPVMAAAALFQSRPKGMTEKEKQMAKQPRQYSRGAGEEVGREMHRYKSGTAKSKSATLTGFICPSQG